MVNEGERLIELEIYSVSGKKVLNTVAQELNLFNSNLFNSNSWSRNVRFSLKV